MYDRYLLLSGEVEITTVNSLGLVQRLGFLSDGAFFGEDIAHTHCTAFARAASCSPGLGSTLHLAINLAIETYRCTRDCLPGETPILDSSSAAEIRRRTVTAVTDCKICFIRREKMVTSCCSMVAIWLLPLCHPVD